MNIKKMLFNGPASPFARPMRTDLSRMERNMLALCPRAGELDAGLGRIISAGGKRLRPLLAWTSWHMSGKEMPIVPLMTMLELMHTTSLIHDDYVDGADTRRGIATINASDGPLAAVRSGDYLLACAMEYLEIYRGTGINEALSTVSQEMCLGELDQHAALFSPANTDEERYYGRIKRKTALLMAESCRSGAVAGGAAEDVSRILRDYGLHLGMAFQIRDDLTDWDRDARSGKPPLRDLKSGVITLPLIYALDAGDELFGRLIAKREKTPGDIDCIVEFTRSCGALDRSYEILKRECADAVCALQQLPPSAERESLLLLAKSIMEVKHGG